MFLKRLSTALIGLACIGNFVLGADNPVGLDATDSGKGNPLEAPLEVTINLTAHKPKCAGDANGYIDAVVSGDNVAPYTFRIQKGSGAIVIAGTQASPIFRFDNLTAGTYTIYVSDSSTPNPQSNQNTTIVSDPPRLTVDLAEPVTYPQCVGERGTLRFQASGGNPPYLYELYNDGSLLQGNATGIFPNLADGLYTLLVEDNSGNNGCTANYDGSILIEVPQAFTISSVEISDIGCYNDFAEQKITGLPSDPFDIVVSNNAQPGKTYSYRGDYIYTNLDAGNYTVTVTRRSCPADRSTTNFTIDPFSAVMLATNPASPVVLDCGGVNDFTDVTVTITGGKTGRQVKLVMDNNDGVANDQQFVVDYNDDVTFTELPSGSYTIRWNDVLNPDCNGTQPYIISNPASPLEWVSDPVGISPLCYGASNGQINVTNKVSGGTPPYNYIVDGTPAVQPIERPAGTYNIFVRDGNGCETETKSVTINPQIPITVLYDNADNVHLSCPRANNGEIHMTVNGGVGNYNYDLMYSLTGTVIRSRVSTGSDVSITSLSGGTYDVLIRDGNDCPSEQITNIFIDEPDPITVDPADFNVLDSITCYGETATVNVKATGGSDATLIYKLYLGTLLVDSVQSSGVVTFTDLIAGAYNIKVFDINPACKNSFVYHFTINDRKKLTVSNLNDSVWVNCPGDDPSVTFSIQGEAPFRYSIGSGTITPIIGNTVTISSGLQASTEGYNNTIFIYDNYNCQTDVSVTIFEPLPISVEERFTENVSCKGKDDGSVTLLLTGGTPGYTVTLTGDETYRQSSSDGNIVIENVAANTSPYSVTITDSKGCPAVNPPTDIEVFEPEQEFEVEYEVLEPALCYGDTVVIRVDALGGWDVTKTVWVEAYGFKSEEKPSGSSFRLTGGNYYIHARNADGCTDKKPFTVTHPPRLRLFNVVATPVSCAGFNDASVKFEIKGGTPGYSWEFVGSGEPATPFADNPHTIDGEELEAGTYELVVTDDNGCASNFVPVTITEPDSVVFKARVDTVTCNGLNDGVIIIYDQDGGNDHDYTAYVTSPGGSEVAWPDFPRIRNLGFGTYQVRIEDSKGCTSETQSVLVDEPEPIYLDNASIQDSLDCHNDMDASILVTASGGLPHSLQYSIDGVNYQADNVFDGLEAGEYEVWVRNNRGNCAEAFPEKILIINPAEVVITGIDKTDQPCHNIKEGEVKINVTGGTGAIEYLLTDAPADVEFNPNITGRFSNLGEITASSARSVRNYNVKVSDEKGCFKTSSFSIVNPAELIADVTDYHQIYCNDQNNGWIELNVQGGNDGGYTFKKNYTDFEETEDVVQINNNKYRLENYAEGDYLPAVIDSKGCSDTITDPIHITNPPRLIIDHVIAGEKRCNFSEDDTTIIVLDLVERGTPPYEYSIDGGDNWSEDSIFINLRDRIVSPRVRDAMDCPAQKPDTSIVWPEPFNVKLTKNEILCWDNPYGTIALEIQGGTGPYYVAYNDDVLFNNSILIEEDEKAQVTIDTVGQDVFYFGNKYNIMIKDDNDCPIQNEGIGDITDTIVTHTWDRPDQFILEKVEPHRPECEGEKGSIKYFTSGGMEPFRYWVTPILSTGTIVATNQDIDGLVDVPVGSYYAFVEDANGCIPTPDAFLATEIAAIRDTVKVEIDTLKQPYCPSTRDGVIGLDVLGFYNGGVRFWIEKYDSVYEEYNSYYETLITREEATDSQEVLFENPDLPDLDPVLEMQYDCENYVVKQKMKMGTYQITFEDVNTGCWVSYNFTLGVDTMECEDIFPLMFTPNNDSYNDNWVVTEYLKSNVDLKIFNGAGEMVRHFKGQVPEDGLKWDGLDDMGRPVPAGTYMWVYQDDVSRDKSNLQYGTITLLRNY